MTMQLLWGNWSYGQVVALADVADGRRKRSRLE
jgi:hypothetical protein